MMTRSLLVLGKQHRQQSTQQSQQQQQQGTGSQINFTSVGHQVNVAISKIPQAHGELNQATTRQQEAGQERDPKLQGESWMYTNNCANTMLLGESWIVLEKSQRLIDIVGFA